MRKRIGHQHSARSNGRSDGRSGASTSPESARFRSERSGHEGAQATIRTAGRSSLVRGGHSSRRGSEASRFDLPLPTTVVERRSRPPLLPVSVFPERGERFVGRSRVRSDAARSVRNAASRNEASRNEASRNEASRNEASRLAATLSFWAFAAALAATFAAPLPCTGAERAVDYDRFVDVLRVPIDGAPLTSNVTATLDFLRAEVVVEIERGRGVADDLIGRARHAVARRGGAVVVGVDEDPPGGPTAVLRYLLATPSVEVRVVASRERKTWFLEVYTLRHAQVDAPSVRLPRQRYTEAGTLPTWGKSMTLAVSAARERLQGIEAALLAEDAAEAQRLLDLLNDFPASAAPWAALLQADVHLETGAIEDARRTLIRIAEDTHDVDAVLLARMRLAEISRAVGQDIAPGTLLAYADQVSEVSDLVREELRARRVRGLFLEGRFPEALAAWQALRRLAPTNPAIDALAGAVRTARFRVIRAAVERGDALQALVAAASIASGPGTDTLERRALPLLALASHALTLFDRESQIRLSRLLEPLPPASVTDELVALVRSYLDSGSDARARMTLEYIERQHGKQVSEDVLSPLRSVFALRDGDFATALDALRVGLERNDAVVPRLRAARLAADLEGTEAAARLIAPLAERAEVPGIGAAEITGIGAAEIRAIDVALRAEVGDCPSVLVEIAAVAPQTVIAAPRTALALARCARTVGGRREALELLDVVSRSAPAVVARAARAEAADLRWEIRNAARLDRFAEPTPSVAPAQEEVAAQEPAPPEPPRRRRRRGTR